MEKRQRIADLYIRVSTDEQAEKGYSQRSQEEMLYKYCEINSITIRKVIFEDYSAKTFNRPEWKAYIADLRKHRNKTDLVLFVKWDRFSRNAGDSYQMINTLRVLGVEPQAIEQPLDMSIPENKMMLAYYLTVPEVENDRRALNVIYGMRRAKKEGRYMGLAPVGYVNRTDEAGRKYIAIEPVQAAILKWAFKEIASEVYNTEQVFKMAKEKGFRGTKSLFWFAIRNPVYCGKIFVPKYRSEESMFVKGQHEAIISEALYYEVQDVLDGRKRSPYKLKLVSNSDLPLRGFLQCPLCGKLLTGSASKGHTKHYTYYHCYKGCNFRFRADNINAQFVDELKKYVPTPQHANVYKMILQEQWEEQTGNLQSDRKMLQQQVKEAEGKLSYLRELLMTKKIDPEDFRDMKSEYSLQLEKLEAKLSACNEEHVNINGLLDAGINNLIRMDEIYINGNSEMRRKVISSMFAEKLHFENNAVRTKDVNTAVSLICLISNKLGGKEEGQNGNSSVLSSQVGETGFEPATPWSQTRCATGLRYSPCR